MGTNYSTTYGAMPLTPMPPGQINVLNHPHLFATTEVYLKMKGKLFSLTDSSDITYLNGAPYARLRGRMMSVKDKHTVECLDGTPLFNVKNVIFSFRGRHEVFFGDTSERLAADIRIVNWGANNVKFEVHVPGNEQPIMIVKGNANMGCYYGFTGQPKEGAPKILSITRVWDAKGIFASAWSYDVAIAANVDIGLGLAMAAAIDEYERERQQGQS